MSTGVRLERKVVQLRRSASPRDFLVLDFTGEVLRAAHYFIRPPRPHYGHGLPAPSPQQMDAGRQAGWFAKGAKREAWVRMAAERDTLEDLLFVLLEHSSHDWQSTVAYIRATEWGAGLP